MGRSEKSVLFSHGDVYGLSLRSSIHWFPLKAMASSSHRAIYKRVRSPAGGVFGQPTVAISLQTSLFTHLATIGTVVWFDINEGNLTYLLFS